MIDGFGSLVGDLGPTGWVTLGTYLVLAVAVASEAVSAIDRSDDLRRTVRRGSALVVTVVGALVAAVPLALVLGLLWRTLGSLAPAPLVRLWASWPLAELVACFVAFDLAAYAYHRLGHTTRVGWASHRVHHMGRSYDLSLVLRQPWFPVHGLVVLPWLALVGFSFEAAALCSTLSIGYQALQHTRRPWRWPAPLDRLLVSAADHRHHHLVDGGADNLGAVLLVWDRWFGTRVGGDASPAAAFGIGVPEPLDPLRVQLDGWRAVRRRTSGGTRSGGYQATVPASASAEISASENPNSANTTGVSTPG